MDLEASLQERFICTIRKPDVREKLTNNNDKLLIKLSL